MNLLGTVWQERDQWSGERVIRVTNSVQDYDNSWVEGITIRNEANPAVEGKPLHRRLRVNSLLRRWKRRTDLEITEPEPAAGFPLQGPIRVPSVDEIAETIANNYGGVHDAHRWVAMREGMRNLHRDEARAVQELMLTPAPELDSAEVIEIRRFGLDKPQGPVEFDFTPGGGDTA